MLCELTDRVGRAVARLSDIVEGGGSGTSTSHCCRTSLFSNQIWRNYRFYVGCSLPRSKRAYRACLSGGSRERTLSGARTRSGCLASETGVEWGIDEPAHPRGGNRADDPGKLGL